METFHYVLIGAVLLLLFFNYNNKTMETYALPKPLNFKNNVFVKFMQDVNSNIFKDIDNKKIDIKKFGFNSRQDFTSSLTSVFCLDRENFENYGRRTKLINKSLHDSIIFKAGFNKNDLKKYNDVDSYCYTVLDDLQLDVPKGYSSLTFPGMKGDEIFNKN